MRSSVSERERALLNKVILIDTYLFIILAIGVTTVAVAWLPALLSKLPVSISLVCVALGYVFGLAPQSEEFLEAFGHAAFMEHLCELAVLLSLAGAGISLDLELSWKAWRTPARLLGITLPLTILLVSLLGYHVLSLPLASAVLLGAICSPTDPVLASEVQVDGPGDDHPVRSILTAEACLNDALAFPFTAAAIYLSTKGEISSWGAQWLAYDVLYRVVVGVLAGLFCGWVLAKGTFSLIRKRPTQAKIMAMIVIGLTCLTYALCELVHGYGFLAVFCAAAYFRRYEKHHASHEDHDDLATQAEHIFMVFFLLMFGFLMHSPWLAALDWEIVLVACVIVFLVRPVTGWIALTGSEHDTRTRFALSFLGIRGIGSAYYLAYAYTHGKFDSFEALWSTLTAVIICSIIAHGASAKTLTKTNT